MRHIELYHDTLTTAVRGNFSAIYPLGKEWEGIQVYEGIVVVQYNRRSLD